MNYNKIASSLRPDLKFQTLKNSYMSRFGQTHTYTNELYNDDLTLLHDINNSGSYNTLFQKYLHLNPQELTWDSFEQNKESIYEKEDERLVVFRQGNVIYKLQKIQDFYDEVVGTEDEDEQDVEIIHEHLREIIFHKLIYEIMLPYDQDNEFLHIPRIHNTYSVYLRKQDKPYKSFFSVIEMEDVGIDFSDYLMELPTNQQRSFMFTNVGIKLLKTLNEINKFIEFVHFDAKLNNILVNNSRFYLIDFGMSHVSYGSLTFSNDLSKSKSVNFISDVVFYIYNALGLSFCSETHIFTEDVIQFCSNIVMQLPKDVNENLCNKLTNSLYKLIYVKNRKTFLNTNFPREFYNFMNLHRLS